MNTFVNQKKIPMIPLMTNVGNKVNIFNNIFAPIDNGSRLPSMEYKGNKRLSNVEINDNDILIIITSLDPNKSHGWDDLSVCMIKMCGCAIVPPLRMIFIDCLDKGLYPSK